jgi:hypothetical protein
MVLWNKFFFFSERSDLSSFVSSKEEPYKGKDNDYPSHLVNTGVPICSEEFFGTCEYLLSRIVNLCYLSLSTTKYKTTEIMKASMDVFVVNDSSWWEEHTNQ